MALASLVAGAGAFVYVSVELKEDARPGAQNGKTSCNGRPWLMEVMGTMDIVGEMREFI